MYALLRIIHFVIVAAYVALPLVTLALAIAHAVRNRSAREVGAWLSTALAGAAIGAGLSAVYVLFTGDKPIVWQIVLACYFGTSLLILLRHFDLLVQWVLEGALRVRQTPPVEQVPTRKWAWRGPLASLARLAALFSIVLPYSMAAVMTYRPKVAPRENPMSLLALPFEEVSFRATDGTKLSGWWIPAHGLPRGHGPATTTVIICHGLGASKANHLFMANDFAPYGFNVLIFDFRAHGQSGGQLCTFGDLERRDVLGAVKWLKQNRGEQAKRVVGVGSSMGAAALIAAAADPTAEGKQIEAIAVYGTFDDLGSLTRSIARERFLWPMNWLAEYVAFPLAELQTGDDLYNFTPANLVHDIWPRPIIVIHGTDDAIIPFEHGERLFDSAQQPKQRLWLYKGDHVGVLHNQGAAKEVREFLRSAEAVPVI